MLIMTLLLVNVPAFSTGQIPDLVHFDGKVYSLIGVSEELPTAGSFGIEPTFSSTANWRGFYSEYFIHDERLLLNRITINSKSGEYPPINGVEADLELGKECFTHKGEERCSTDGGVYVGVDLKIPFTGRIRVAAEFIDELYVHMGTQKPSAFRIVLDLRFEGGRLTETVDRSSEAADIRGNFHREYYENLHKDNVERAFSLDMEPLQ